MLSRSERSIAHLLEQRAQHTPEALAYRFLDDSGAESERLTFAQLAQRAREVASLLVAEGAQPGDRALLVHPPGLSYIAALFGCFRAGVVAVPAFPPRRGAMMERLAAMSRSAGARFALTDARALARLKTSLAEQACLSGLRWLASDVAAHDAALPELGQLAQPEALALLQYTSGSTREPKGVMVEHRHFLANAEMLRAALSLGSSDCIVLWLPPYHDMGLVGGAIVPVHSGASAVLMSPASFVRRPALWLEALSRYRGTITAAPNFGYELAARRHQQAAREPLDLSALRVALNGAERVSMDSMRRFAEVFAPHGLSAGALMPCYGLAEATLAVTLARRAAQEPLQSLHVDGAALGRGQVVTAPAQGIELASCGAPLPGCDVRIVDPELHSQLPAGQVGEIWVRSASVTAGYFARAADSAAAFDVRLAQESDGYLRTGDLGFLHEGELFVTGRLKDLMIVAGVNHYPEDVEACVQRALEDSGVRALAFSMEGAQQERLVVVCELPTREPLDFARLAAQAREAVAEAYQLPINDVVFVGPGGLPRTSSGKLQRARCRELYSAQSLRTLAQVAEPQQQAAPEPVLGPLRRLVAELLRLPDVAPEDDLFMLGLHSLLATQLVARVRESMGVELPLRLVFEASSVAQLAARIAGLPRVSPAAPLSPSARAGTLPLSFSQERMWLLHQLDPHGTAYNVAGALRIQGPLDVARLRQAFDGVLARHEVLRCNFPSLEGEPRVLVAPQRKLELPLCDVSHEPDAYGCAVQHASQLAQQPFDIARDALLRAGLWRLGPEDHVLAVSLHHLVTDGWSMGILLHDVFALYKGDAALPALSTSFVDYAHHQRTQLAQQRFQAQRAYWLKQLAGAPPLELPTDRPRLEQQRSPGAFLQLELPPALREALRETAQRQGVTLFMLMLTAFQVLLQRYSGQRDLTVGVPIANRNQLAAEPFIGSLVNTLAIRAQLEPSESLGQLLKRVRDTCLDAYAHQDYPFERLVAELGVERSAGRSPLVQVMFDFQNAPIEHPRGAGVELTPVVISRGAAQFELSLLIMDTQLAFRAGLEYRSDLFDRDTAAALLRHYTAILECFVDAPATPVSKVPLLDAIEQRHIVALGTRAGSAGQTFDCLPSRIASWAARTPHAPAVSDAQRSLSYADLEREATQLARRLSARGVGPGVRVAVLLSRSAHVVVALYAVLKTGASYVPLDPLYPPERRALVLEDAAPRLLLTERRFAYDPALPAQLTRLSLDEPDGLQADPARAALNDPARPAYVLYTSGSTGRPKGVEVPMHALCNFLGSMAHQPGMLAGDKLLSVTTIAFDIAGLELFLPLVCGAGVHVAPAEVVMDGPALEALRAGLRPTHLQATPATFKLLFEAGFQGDEALHVLCGGEAFPRDLANRLVACCASVWNVYGPTETTIWSTLARVTPGQGPVPIGRPIDHTSVYVLDGEGALCPLGVHGELFIGGRGVANGYLGQAQLTAERFVPDPFSPEPGARMYRTGDRACVRASGTFYCLGRLDHQIKIRGYRVEPGEIEVICKRQLALRDVVVVAREDRPGDVRLVAYYVPGEDTPPQHALREPLTQHLPEYMIPSAFVVLPALPQTPNGKIDRAALPAPPQDAGRAGTYVAPRDELEERLAQLWAELLGGALPGIRDNFFHVGGHSLLAVRLFARIERELGVRLPLAVLLEGGSTVEGLAARVRMAQDNQDDLEPSGVMETVSPFEHLLRLR